jgi:hypothetical protein
VWGLGGARREGGPAGRGQGSGRRRGPGADTGGAGRALDARAPGGAGGTRASRALRLTGGHDAVELLGVVPVFDHRGHRGLIGAGREAGGGEGWGRAPEGGSALLEAGGGGRRQRQGCLLAPTAWGPAGGCPAGASPRGGRPHRPPLRPPPPPCAPPSRVLPEIADEGEALRRGTRGARRRRGKQQREQQCGAARPGGGRHRGGAGGAHGAHAGAARLAGVGGHAWRARARACWWAGCGRLEAVRGGSARPRGRVRRGRWPRQCGARARGGFGVGARVLLLAAGDKGARGQKRVPERAGGRRAWPSGKRDQRPLARGRAPTAPAAPVKRQQRHTVLGPWRAAPLALAAGPGRARRQVHAAHHTGPAWGGGGRCKARASCGLRSGRAPHGRAGAGPAGHLAARRPQLSLAGGGRWAQRQLLRAWGALSIGPSCVASAGTCRRDRPDAGGWRLGRQSGPQAGATGEGSKCTAGGTVPAAVPAYARCSVARGQGGPFARDAAPSARGGGAAPAHRHRGRACGCAPSAAAPRGTQAAPPPRARLFDKFSSLFA